MGQPEDDKDFNLNDRIYSSMALPDAILERKLLAFLAEDLGQGDVTTELIAPKDATVEAEIISKAAGIVAGIEEAKVLLRNLGLKVECFVKDGDEIEQRQKLIKISGNSRTILSAERTLLNIVSRMSGIATATRKLVTQMERQGMKTKIACTRKTAPGLMFLDKKAVAIGGGDTHRLHLDDMCLIKDNHIKVAGGLEQAIRSVKNGVSFTKKIEVETTNCSEALRAAKAGVDVIMLDNFSLSEARRTIKALRDAGLYGKTLLEASGGINKDNVNDYASIGVDIVSLSEITASVRTLDLSLEVTFKRKRETLSEADRR